MSGASGVPELQILSYIRPNPADGGICNCDGTT
jgi:hypothetical protein